MTRSVPCRSLSRRGLALWASLFAWGLGVAGCDDDPTPKADATDAAVADGDTGGTVADGQATPDGQGTDATPGTDAVIDGGDAATAGVLTPRSLRFDVDLHGVWGTSPQDVWLVGKKGTLLHWNGKTLAPRASGTTKDLLAVGGRGASDVWFVGDGVALRWDGSKITDLTPAGAGVLRGLHAPADGSAIYVAGDGGVVLRRQGIDWQTEPTGTKLNLHAIWAVNGGLVWAVGDQGQALKLAGGTWTTVQIPKASKPLRTITGSPAGRLFTAGDGPYLGATVGGGVWEATPANDPDKRTIRGLFAASDSDAWAIGDGGSLLHFTDGKWKVEQIAGTYMKLRSFHGLWGQAAKAPAKPFALAVGEAGAGVLFDGESKWQDFKAETTADLRSVQVLNGGGLLACGAGGLVLQAEAADAAFYDLAAPVTATDLNDCTGDGSEIVAVGANGVIARRSGGAWTVETMAGQPTLTGVARLDSGDLLAVGDGGQAFKRSGGTWTAETTGTQIPLRSVATSGKIAYAVGEFGTILRRGEDGKWAPESSGEGLRLDRVLAWSDNDAVAVGDAGVVLLRKDGKWTKVYEAPGSPLFGATRRADGTIVAVGWGGILVVGAPSGAFHKVESGVPNVLRAVAATPKGTVAVGMKGGVFQVAEVLP